MKNLFTTTTLSQSTRSRLLLLHDASLAATSLLPDVRAMATNVALTSRAKLRHQRKVERIQQEMEARYLGILSKKSSSSSSSSNINNNNNVSSSSFSSLSSSSSLSQQQKSSSNNNKNSEINNMNNTTLSVTPHKPQEQFAKTLREMLKPLQQPPQAANSPLIPFSPVPLFAVDVITNNNINRAKNSNSDSNNMKKTREEGKENIVVVSDLVEKSNEQVFFSKNNNSVDEFNSSIQHWMPKVDVASNYFIRSMTMSNQKDDDDDQTRIEVARITPHHILPQGGGLKKIRGKLVKNWFSGEYQMSFYVGKDNLSSLSSSSSSSSSSLLLSEKTNDEKHNDNNENNNNNNNSLLWVSFNGLACPLPPSVSETMNVEMNNNKNKNKNISNNNRFHRFWSKRFRKCFGAPPPTTTTPSSSSQQHEVEKEKQNVVTDNKNNKNKKSLVLTSEYTTAGPASRVPVSFLPALWWFYLWLHRNHSARWLLDLKHLSVSSAAATATTTKSSSSTINKKDNSVKMEMSDVETDTNNKNVLNRKALRKLRRRRSKKFLSAATLTSRKIREADIRGQPKKCDDVEKKKEEEGKNVESTKKRKQRIKGGKQKKSSSSLKKLLSAQKTSSSSSSSSVWNYQFSDMSFSSSSSNQNNNLIGNASAHDYLMWRLERHFLSMKGNGMRCLLRNFRLFLHYVDLAGVNEKSLNRNSNRNNNVSLLQQFLNFEKNNNKKIRFNIISDKKEHKKFIQTESNSLLHSSLMLPKDVYFSELHIWREWRFIYSYFPALSLRVALHASGLQFWGDNNSQKNQNFPFSSSSFSSSSKEEVAISPTLCFRPKENIDKSFHRLSDSAVLSNGYLRSSSITNNNNIDSTQKQNQISTTPTTSVTALLNSPEISDLDQLEQLRNRSGFWVFRGALPALYPQTFWKHFTISNVTATKLWDRIPGTSKTLFDTVPLKRRSETRRHEPFYAYLRQCVREEAGKQRKYNSNANNNKISNSDFTETKNNNNIFVPKTIGEVCALARKNWKRMHPYEQAQYYDTETIQAVFPDFEGFKKSDAEVVKKMFEEVEERENKMNNNNMYSSSYDRMEGDDYFDAENLELFERLKEEE